MAIEIRDHSIKGWQEFTDEAGFVPDPMILRTGEVFLNGMSGSNRLGKSDQEVLAALQENIAGLTDFFDLLITRDRIPLIDYNYTFDMDSVRTPIGDLLGAKALPVKVDYGPYEIVKRGAYRSLMQIDPAQIRAFSSQLRELDSLRYDWQPSLDDYQEGDSWLSHIDKKDEATCRAARFLLGGFIFSGFAQASGTDHYIQPKRSRFFLSLTAAPQSFGQIGHDVEQPIFDEAFDGLKGTTATAHRLDGLPPVLPYLIAKAPERATAADILELALAFPETSEGRHYCDAASLLRKDGIRAQQTRDAAFTAREEALKMLRPYSELADRDGGFQIEASVGSSGPELKVSKAFHLPVWLQLWWNDRTPFGSMRKTFRRMWMTAESYENLERQVRQVWARS